MDEQTETKVQAAVLRKLLQHLQHRTDAQNIDLMGLSGFCRNCLSDWYREAAAAEGIELSKEASREAIYGMPYGTFKAQHQSPATDAQLALMQESIKKNEGRGF